MPAHNGPSSIASSKNPARGCRNRHSRGCQFLEGEGTMPLYRKQTERILRRYFQLSLDLGRLPSVVGGEIFRARVSSSRLHTFEDFLIFVHDVERRLEELRPEALEMLAAMVFLDLSQQEAGMALGLSRRQVMRRYATALDELSRRLLVTGLMRPLPELSLREPDCAVCLHNPEFVIDDEEESSAVPKKPAASVRPELPSARPKLPANVVCLGSGVVHNRPS